MGHPISPGDPVNGGVPTCLEYMPPQLFAKVWRWIGVPTYWDGVIDEFPEDSAKYGGLVFGVTPPQLFFIEFGILDPPRVQAWMDIAPFVPLFGTHCNLPVSFATPPETGPSFSAIVQEV